MVTQTAITYKADSRLLRELDKEAFYSVHKRNRIINDAVRLYLDMADARRTAGCLPSTIKPHPAVASVLDKWLPKLMERPEQKSIDF